MWGLERHASSVWAQEPAEQLHRARSQGSSVRPSLRSSLSSQQQRGTLFFLGFQAHRLEEGSGLRFCLRKLLASPSFDYFTCAITVLNALVIGLEQNCRMDCGADCLLFERTESSLVLYYFLEISAVLLAFGPLALQSNWVRLDLALVLVGLLSQLLLLAQQLLQVGKYLQVLKLLRIARMLRLARTLRAVLRFREFCMLAQGFLNSLNMLMHTLILGLALLYICSCTAMELIPLSMAESSEEGLSEELRASLETHFRSLPITMLSLLQFFSFDSSHVIYRPWVEAQPITALFFVSCLLLMGVVFMNLVTAVIINGALEDAMQDHEMQRAMTKSKRKALLQSLRAAFEEADENRSGELSMHELLQIYKRETRLMHGILGNKNDFVKLFNYLDVDGNGYIGIGELCNGIEDLVLSEAPLELKRMERMVESMREQLKHSQRLQEQLCGALLRQSQASSAVCSSKGTVTPQHCDWPEKHVVRPKPAPAPVQENESDKSSDCCFTDAQPPLPAWAGEMIAGLRTLDTRLTEALLSLAAPTEAQLAVETVLASGGLPFKEGVEETAAEEALEEADALEPAGHLGSWASLDASPQPPPRALDASLGLCCSSSGTRILV